MEKIITAVNQLLEQEFEIDPDLLKPEALLKEDLDLDSLDAVDMIVAIDHEFGIRIEEEQAKNLRILKDIYDIIHDLATAEVGDTDR
ncbi:MAG: acyl carrier protein [Desulfobacterium sp.]|nr:acyl carrier protein [Desulfobacterium sp.]